MNKDPVVEITPAGYRVDDTEVTNGDAFVTQSPQDLCPFCYLWGVEPHMLTEGMVFRIHSKVLATIEFGPIPDLITAVQDIARTVNKTGAPWHQLQMSWTHKPVDKDMITFLVQMTAPQNPTLAGVFKPVIATDHEGGWQYDDARIPAFSEDLLSIYRIYDYLAESAGWYRAPESGILVESRSIRITPEGIVLSLLRDTRWTQKPRCSFNTVHMARINRVLAERGEMSITPALPKEDEAALLQQIEKKDREQLAAQSVPFEQLPIYRIASGQGGLTSTITSRPVAGRDYYSSIEFNVTRYYLNHVTGNVYWWNHIDSWLVAQSPRNLTEEEIHRIEELLEGRDVTRYFAQPVDMKVDPAQPGEDKTVTTVDRVSTHTMKRPGSPQIPGFLKTIMPAMALEMSVFDPENAQLYRDLAGSMLKDQEKPEFLTTAEAHKTPVYRYMSVPLDAVSSHLAALTWRKVPSQTNYLMMGSHSGLMTDFYGGLYIINDNNELLNARGGDLPLHLREVVELANVTDIAGRYTNVFWKNHGFHIEPSPLPSGMSVLSRPELIYESSRGQAYMYDGKHGWLIREKSGATPEQGEMKPKEPLPEAEPEENVLLPQLLKNRPAPKDPVKDLRNQAKENTPLANPDKIIQNILGNVDGVREAQAFSLLVDFHVIGSQGETAQIEAGDLRYLEKMARERGMLAGDTLQLLPHGAIIERRGPMEWLISGR